MIAEPPLSVGAAHVTDRLLLLLMATTELGALGTCALGLAGAEFADGGLIPIAF